EHTQPGAVDVSRLTEVDQELFLATLELVEHLLLELLAVSHYELTLHVHHDNISLLPECETHVSVSRRNSRAFRTRAEPDPGVARIERLQRRDRGHIDNVVGRGAARKIGAWPREALHYRSDRPRVCQ